MDNTRTSRWFVLFADGSIETVVEEAEDEFVRLTIHGRSGLYLNNSHEIGWGVRDLYDALALRNGARFLIDTATIARDLAALNARFSGP